MKINKDKRIGKALFILEGSATEFNLLKKIMIDIFQFRMITKKREIDGKEQVIKKYGKDKSKNSTIYAINTSESNIKFINDREYIEKIYEQLRHEYGFTIENMKIYYIFDRDPKSNLDIELMRHLIVRFSNAFDMGIDEQGLLLLSYPCIESFTLSNFDDEFHKKKFATGKGEDQLRQYLATNKILPNNISENTLQKATLGLLNAFDEYNIDFEERDLDDFAECGLSIFNQKEDFYTKNAEYRCLSLFALALIDLGLIEL